MFARGFIPSGAAEEDEESRAAPLTLTLTLTSGSVNICMNK